MTDRSHRSSHTVFLRRARRIIEEYSDFLEYINEGELLSAIFSTDDSASPEGLTNALEKELASPIIELITSAFQNLSSGGMYASQFYEAYVLLVSSLENFENIEEVSNVLENVGIAYGADSDISNQEAVERLQDLIGVSDSVRQQIEDGVSGAQENINQNRRNISEQVTESLKQKFVLVVPSNDNPGLNIFRQPDNPPPALVFEDEYAVDFPPELIDQLTTNISRRLNPGPLRDEPEEEIELSTGEQRETVVRMPAQNIETFLASNPTFKFNEQPLNNPDPENPDRGPNLVSVLVNDVQLMPSSRDTGIGELFMNFIPSVEMSRAVPYLDIGLCIPGSNSPDSRAQVVTLASSLGYKPTEDENDPNNLFFTGLDSTEVGIENRNVRSGIELFTAPQTLTDRRQFIEPDDLAAGNSLSTALPLDRFKPFASFSGLTIDVVNSNGLISHKTAKMTITVHDRGRLHELAAFIKPELYSRTHLYVEYGWSHPDDDIDKNPFGYLINTLRVVEKYTIVNSSFSLDDSGQVQVDIQLFARGSERLNLADISRGEGVEVVYEKIEEQVEVINTALQNLRDDETVQSELADIFSSQVLGAVTSTDSSVTAVDDDVREEIFEIINQRIESSTDNEDLTNIRDALVTIYGESDAESQSPDSAPLVSQLEATIAVSLELKRRLLYNGIDTFLSDQSVKSIRPTAAGTIEETEIGTDDYVSLGKLLNIYVGKPLAATRRFAEVQLLFYPFNANSSNLRNISTANFPIKKREFERMLQEETELTANLPLERFINILNRDFVANQASEIYGFSSLYGPADENGRRELIEELQNDQTRYVGLKQQLLRNVYGGDTEEAIFKLPDLQFHVEAVPVRSNINVDTDRSTALYNTILRIHIFDASASPYESALSVYRAATTNRLNAIRRPRDEENDEMSHGAVAQALIDRAIQDGILEVLPRNSVQTATEERIPETYRIRGGVGGIKRYMRKVVPSVRYGTPGSAIIQASFDSLADSSLSTIHMLRAGSGGDGPPGVRDGGLPLRISPTEVNVETFGYPFFNIGQQFFFDFDTGTTADNIYGVAGASHSLEPGRFTSSVKLVPIGDAYGEYRALVDEIANAIRTIRSSESEEEVL